MTKFKIGDKVTRKNKNESWTDVVTGKTDDYGPAWGQVLIVNCIMHDPTFALCKTWLVFAEWPTESFEAACFEKVVERKTDISSLVALLKPIKQEIDA